MYYYSGTQDEDKIMAKAKKKRKSGKKVVKEHVEQQASNIERCPLTGEPLGGHQLRKALRRRALLKLDTTNAKVKEEREV